MGSCLSCLSCQTTPTQLQSYSTSEEEENEKEIDNVVDRENVEEKENVKENENVGEQYVEGLEYVEEQENVEGQESVEGQEYVKVQENVGVQDYVEEQENVEGQEYVEEQENVEGQENEKCYDPEDSTFTFVDREDEMDFLYIGYKSRRALMSCGHSVTPMSLTNWCRYLLDQHEHRFVCGQPNCDAVWPYKEVRKMALLTPEEMKEFEKKTFINCKDIFDVKSCPGCKYRVVRTDLNDLSVHCSVCTTEKKKVYRFCWQCLREWKGPAPRSDRCDNDDCVIQPLETLTKCSEIIFEDVVGVTGCPSIRACPTCGLLLEHNRKKCKNIVCHRCKVEFCFVCLKVSKECSNITGSYFKTCSDGVAPRQTSIPVWQRK
ncbi:ankyrin repeat and IBR domain-containing protein 1-like [Scomber scombrus]|uniref:ankyrin repeat and IBR domain-containing protein 1-like n=1 Tax=Scomber scombrus TaxID=13677 RepID=UPI002DD9817E|nr:ankyrin repeat and IBR domain-containing protein 1-like [Scomber scombrus]